MSLVLARIRLLNISKRRGEVKDKSSNGKDSKNRPEVSTVVANTGGNKVGILGNVGNGEVSRLNHHLGLSARGEGGARYCVS
jgi:hypothetical protein